MSIIKIKLILLFSLILFSYGCAKSNPPSVDLKKIEQKAKEALTFCENKNYNTDYCILIDMSLHSGVKRLFLWNFKTNIIEYSVALPFLGHL